MQKKSALPKFSQVECRYGKWYATDTPVTKPSCTPIVCNPPTIENGKLATGESVRYKAGEEADVLCNDGFEIRASSKVICTGDGSWESADHTEFPACKGRKIFF